MSVCLPCYDAGSYVNACATEFSFGEVEASTVFFVSLQHHATGAIVQYEVTSDGDGQLTIDGITLDALQGYTVWVTLTAGSQVREDITVDGDIYTCLSFSSANFL